MIKWIYTEGAWWLLGDHRPTGPASTLKLATKKAPTVARRLARGV